MPPKRATKKAYGKASVVAEGTVLTDYRKTKWKLGKAFASGGFGRIYSASQVDGDRRAYVAKMEPMGNGPLYAETHVYQNIAKPERIQQWTSAKKLKFLGIPPYCGGGQHDIDGVTQRFLIMRRYGKDLESVRAHSPSLPPGQVFGLAKTCMDALQYMHDQHYVHADLKAENLLFASVDSKDMTKMVLVDFGLAYKVPDQPVCKEDPKTCHNGTLPFTSIDAHRGCRPSYRGDVEILAYNVLYWITGSLPWIKDEQNPDTVHKKKVDFSKNVATNCKKLLPSGCAFVRELTQLFESVYSLDYAQRPDYDLLKKLFDSAAKKLATKGRNPSVSSAAKSPALNTRSRTSGGKRSFEQASTASESDSENDIIPKTPSPVLNKRLRTMRLKSTNESVKATPPKVAKTTAAPKPQVNNANRIVPGVANMVGSKAKSAPLTIKKSDGSSVVIPKAALPRTGAPNKVVQKYVRQERRKSAVKPKSKRGLKPPMTECTTQTSPGMWD